MRFDQNNTGGRSMAKVTVRLSTECEAALAEAEANGINNSEFIRSAILSYQSSGCWKTQNGSEQVEKSMSTKELRMSDITSDRMSDRFKAETSESKSLGVEQMKPRQQMYSPKLDQLHACSQSRSIKWTTPWVSALVVIAIAAIIFLAIEFQKSDQPSRR
jgi:Arc/MetJ-type ribon-helix-helix transcriptional regulator